MRALGQLNVAQKLSRALLRVFEARDLHRRENVFERGHRGDEVEGLEDEADLAPAKRCERVLAHARYLLAVNANLARRGRVESGDEAEQR